MPLGILLSQGSNPGLWHQGDKGRVGGEGGFSELVTTGRARDEQQDGGFEHPGFETRQQPSSRQR